MLAKRIIPCLDVHDGRVVKGVQFVDLADAGDPVEQARFYADAVLAASTFHFRQFSIPKQHLRAADIPVRSTDVTVTP